MYVRGDAQANVQRELWPCVGRLQVFVPVSACPSLFSSEHALLHPIDLYKSWQLGFRFL